jgi:4-amino-4-deoxy-L-arabinose transferase-like glycosyltransferase
LVGVLVALHLALAAAMGLSVDEAHYLLYAAHPDFSYFDHPPLVGWVQWPLVALNAPTVLLRAVPGGLWLGTVLGAYRLAHRLATQDAAARSGLWTVVVLGLAPLLHVLAIGLLPDTLLMFFTVAVMLQTHTLMQPGALERPLAWLGLSVLLGLAGLSKYTAIFLALACALCLFSVHGLRLMRLPALWGALVLALLLVAPVAVWNANKGWVSFAYQAQHGAGSVWRSQEVLRFVLVQLLAYGPLLWWGALARTRLGVMRWFFVLPFAVLAYLSGGGSGLPHWTAPAWVALAPFAGVALAAQWRTGTWVGGRALIAGLAGLQALACAGLLGLMLSGGAPLLPRSLDDTPVGANPFADLYGWQAAGARARSLATEQGLASVAVQNWTLASRLGWYARPLPVHVLEDRFDQFDIWAGDLAVGGDTLLVDWSAMAYTVPLGDYGFRDCTLLDTQDATHWGAPLARFRFYACHGWSGSPQPRLTLE